VTGHVDRHKDVRCGSSPDFLHNQQTDGYKTYVTDGTQINQNLVSMTVHNHKNHELARVQRPPTTKGYNYSELLLEIKCYLFI
jgi:hypothetical protein